MQLLKYAMDPKAWVILKTDLGASEERLVMEAAEHL